MRFLLPPLLLVSLAAACSSSSAPGQPAADAGGDDGGTGDAATCASPPCATTKIEHLVVVVQENHTFDNYFGRWCTAATSSGPTCTQGPSCCEAGPAMDPGSSTAPGTLNDTVNGQRDPNHAQVCETTEIDGGKMDGFVTSPSCGAALNFVYADAATAQPYWDLAQAGALADHYFQPVVGQSSSNDMYLARARFVFLDNKFEPQAIGSTCAFNAVTQQYTDTTIVDLLDQAGVGWAFYSEGYATMVSAVAAGGCPAAAPPDCAFNSIGIDCVYDPSSDPFAYFKSVADDPRHFKDYADLARDVAAGTLPAVVFVKAAEYKTEHPGYKNKISDGVAFVKGTFGAIQQSAYAASTLLVLTYDEGGGYFDHVTPPATSAVDNQPYGTRVPAIASGPFARAGTVSHAVMEHSSLVKFIEYNWLGGKTGQLGARDAAVANIGSLLDPSLGVPEN